MTTLSSSSACIEQVEYTTRSAEGTRFVRRLTRVKVRTLECMQDHLKLESGKLFESLKLGVGFLGDILQKSAWAAAHNTLSSSR